MSRPSVSEFANYHGNEELPNTELRVSDFLRDLKIKEPQNHTLIIFINIHYDVHFAFKKDNHASVH